ncbi:RNA-binding protein [Schizosaccharomyces pombe]
MDSHVLAFPIPDPSTPPPEEASLYASKCDYYESDIYSQIRRLTEEKCIETEKELPVNIKLHVKHKGMSISSSRNELVVTVSGNYKNVYTAKIKILQAIPKILISKLVLEEPLENLLFDEDGYVYEDTMKHLDKITEITGAKIYIMHRSMCHDIDFQLRTDSGFSNRLNEQQSFYQRHLESTRHEFSCQKNAENSFFIVFYGDYCSVEHARIRVLALMDEIRGLSVVAIATSVSFQPILVGKAFSSTAGMKATESINIYTLPFCSDSIPRLQTLPALNSSKIIITGEEEKLQRLEEAFYYAEEHLKLFTHVTEISFVKLFEFLAYEMDELRLIMEENSSFIRFPEYFKEGGETSPENSKVKIYSSSIANSEKTALRLAKLASKYVQGKTQFGVEDNEDFLRVAGSWRRASTIEKGVSSSELSSAVSSTGSIVETNGIGEKMSFSPLKKLSIPPTEFVAQIAIICMASGVEMLLKTNGIEYFGQENTVPIAMDKASKIFYKFGQSQWHQILLEAPTKDQDFISGKKNGKLDKVKQQCRFNLKNGDILFCPQSTSIFTVDIYSDELERVIKGMNTMLLEFPAEMHFYVPEEIHKKLIGFRGEQIQRVTKLYNSYIEFSTTPFDCYGHNVLIRTPSKFSENLWAVRSLFIKTAEGLGYDIPKYLFAN